MSKERELLRRISSHSGTTMDTHFIKEIQALLTQPEQEPTNFDLERMKLAVESPISDVTVEGLIDKVKSNRVFYQEGYAQAELDLKREPFSEDKLDVLAEANISDEAIAGYYLGFRDAEKYHGIGG